MHVVGSDAQNVRCDIPPPGRIRQLKTLTMRISHLTTLGTLQGGSRTAGCWRRSYLDLGTSLACFLSWPGSRAALVSCGLTYYILIPAPDSGLLARCLLGRLDTSAGQVIDGSLE